MNKIAFYLVALATVFATGCAPFQPSTYPAPTSESGSTATYPPPASDTGSSSTTQPNPDPDYQIKPDGGQASTTDSAVQSLIDQSWDLYREGYYDRAIAVAERAQRLDPTEPEVYLLIASNYYALAEYRLAEQLARQGLPLSRVGSLIERQLKALIREISIADG
ncbi:MAG: tetratricopeptide repeat protein [bacterium]